MYCYFREIILSLMSLKDALEPFPLICIKPVPSSGDGKLLRETRQGRSKCLQCPRSCSLKKKKKKYQTSRSQPQIEVWSLQPLVFTILLLCPSRIIWTKTSKNIHLFLHLFCLWRKFQVFH